MSTLVESLRRLYVAVKITNTKLGDMLTEGKITQEEHDYIIA